MSGPERFDDPTPVPPPADLPEPDTEPNNVVDLAYWRRVNAETHCWMGGHACAREEFPSEAAGLSFQQRVALALDEARQLLAEAAAVFDEACTIVPDDVPDWERDRESWAEAAREYRQERGDRPFVVEHRPSELARLRRLMADGVTLDRACWEMQAHHARQGAARLTVEALALALRERGTAALSEPAVRQRLRQCDLKQVFEIGDRLLGLARHGLWPWSTDEVRRLLEWWEATQR